MKMLDANMILRFLLDDNKEMSQTVSDIINCNTVVVTAEVIAEVIYVMKGIYKIPKSDIYNALTKFLKIGNIISENKKVITKGLEFYNQNNLDFVDCLLCAYHTESGYEICTFDKKLIKTIKKKDEK